MDPKISVNLLAKLGILNSVITCIFIPNQSLVASAASGNEDKGKWHLSESSSTGIKYILHKNIQTNLPIYCTQGMG